MSDETKCPEVIRFEKHSSSGHIEQLEAWLGREIAVWELPSFGLIVPGVATLFIRHCENICTFECLATNPQCASAERAVAIKALVDAATKYAKRRYLAIWCTTTTPTVAQRLSDLGFRETKEQSFIKVL